MKYSCLTIEAIIDEYFDKINCDDENVLRETRPCESLFDLLNGYLLREGNNDSALNEFDFGDMEILIAGKSAQASNLARDIVKNQFYYTLFIQSVNRMDLLSNNKTKKWAKSIAEDINKILSPKSDWTSRFNLKAIQEINSAKNSTEERLELQELISDLQASAEFKNLFDKFMSIESIDENVSRIFYKYLMLGKKVILNQNNRNTQSTVSLLLSGSFRDILFANEKGVSESTINSYYILNNLINMTYDKCSFENEGSYSFSNDIKGSNEISSSGSFGLFEPGHNYNDDEIKSFVIKNNYKMIDRLSKIDKDKLFKVEGICGRTLLHIAAIKSDPKMVNLLLDIGFNPNTLDRSNSTVFIVAEKSQNQNREAILEVLRKKNRIDVNKLQ